VPGVLRVRANRLRALSLDPGRPTVTLIASEIGDPATLGRDWADALTALDTAVYTLLLLGGGTLLRATGRHELTVLGRTISRPGREP
jgi:hypothetical protein